MHVQSLKMPLLAQSVCHVMTKTKRNQSILSLAAILYAEPVSRCSRLHLKFEVEVVTGKLYLGSFYFLLQRICICSGILKRILCPICRGMTSCSSGIDSLPTNHDKLYLLKLEQPLNNNEEWYFFLEFCFFKFPVFMKTV